MRGINPYQFNGNNPVTYTDPFGLCPPEDANDGPHCVMTAGATNATPGQLKSAYEGEVSRPREGEMILGASATAGIVTQSISKNGVESSMIGGPAAVRRKH